MGTWYKPWTWGKKEPEYIYVPPAEPAPSGVVTPTTVTPTGVGETPTQYAERISRGRGAPTPTTVEVARAIGAPTITPTPPAPTSITPARTISAQMAEAPLEKPKLYPTVSFKEKRIDWGIGITPTILVGTKWVHEKTLKKVFPPETSGVGRWLEKPAPPWSVGMLDIFVKGAIFSPYMATGVAAKTKVKMKEPEIKYVRKFGPEEATEKGQAMLGKIEQAYIKKGKVGAEKEVLKMLKQLKSPEARRGAMEFLKGLQEKGLIREFIYKPTMGKIAFAKQLPSQIWIQKAPTMKGVEYVEAGAKVAEYTPIQKFKPMGVIRGKIPTGILAPTMEVKMKGIPAVKQLPKISIGPRIREIPRQKPKPIFAMPTKQILKQPQIPKQIPLLKQPQLPKQKQPQIPKQAPRYKYPFPAMPKPEIKFPKPTAPPFLFPLFPKLWGAPPKKRKKGVRPTRSTKYIPSLPAIAYKFKAFKIPKAYKFGAGGIIRRPIIKTKRKKKRRKK